jgi:hypothetical protein
MSRSKLFCAAPWAVDTSGLHYCIPTTACLMENDARRACAGDWEYEILRARPDIRNLRVSAFDLTRERFRTDT